MKHLLLAAGLVLAGAATAQGQITLERTHLGRGTVIRLNNGDYKYSLTDAVNANQVVLYNLNHSIYRQLTAPSAGVGYVFGRADYVSDALFDTDANTVEFVATYYNSAVNLSKTIICSQSGAQIIAFDSTNQIFIYNTSAGAKLLKGGFLYGSPAGAPIREFTRIYSLPGRLALRATTPNLPDVAGAYPNPARETVTLPYTLPTGGRGVVRVYDVAGRLAATYQVDSHTDHLTLTTQDLRPGVYLYQVETATGTTAGQRFVVE